MNGAFADPILYLELCDRALCRASAGRDGTNSAGQWNAAPSPAAAGAAPLMRLGFVRCKSLPRSQRALFATQPGLPTRSDTSPDLVRWQSHLAELGLTWFLFHKLNSPAPWQRDNGLFNGLSPCSLCCPVWRVYVSWPCKCGHSRCLYCWNVLSWYSKAPLHYLRQMFVYESWSKTFTWSKEKWTGTRYAQ